MSPCIPIDGGFICGDSKITEAAMEEIRQYKAFLLLKGKGKVSGTFNEWRASRRAPAAEKP